MLTDAQFLLERERPEILRSCGYCDNIISALSLWCGSKEAIEARGTSIPGCIHCPFWKPDSSAKKKMAKNATKDIEGYWYWGIKILN